MTNVARFLVVVLLLSTRASAFSLFTSAVKETPPPAPSVAATVTPLPTVMPTPSVTLQPTPTPSPTPTTALSPMEGSPVVVTVEGSSAALGIPAISPPPASGPGFSETVPLTIWDFQSSDMVYLSTPQLIEIPYAGDGGMLWSMPMPGEIEAFEVILPQDPITYNLGFDLSGAAYVAGTLPPSTLPAPSSTPNFVTASSAQSELRVTLRASGGYLFRVTLRNPDGGNYYRYFQVEYGLLRLVAGAPDCFPFIGTYQSVTSHTLNPSVFAVSNDSFPTEGVKMFANSQVITLLRDLWDMVNVRRNVVGIMAHGNNGSFSVGTSRVTYDNARPSGLSMAAEAFSFIRGNIGTRLELIACCVAAGTGGATFLPRFARYLGVDVYGYDRTMNIAWLNPFRPYRLQGVVALSIPTDTTTWWRARP